MEKSHASDWDSQPTPAQMKEFYAQVEARRITKGNFQQFLRGNHPSTTTVEVAKEIMGTKNFFGPDKWIKFFGKKIQFANIPEIRWNRSEIENPGINQGHFLFLGTDKLNEKPLDIIAWQKLFSGETHPKFYLDWYLTHKFAKKTCGLRWYLMPIDIVKGSNNLSYNQQNQMLPSEYEVPSVIERVSANVLYYLLNKKYLDMGYWARTNDLSDGGRRVNVQGNSDDGLFISLWSDNANLHVGGAASRKFKS